jgi:hypothetical protein
MEGTMIILVANYVLETMLEGDGFSTSQEIRRILLNPNIHYHIAAIDFCLEPDETNNNFTPPNSIYLRFIVILSRSLCLDLPSGLFRADFPTKTLYAHLIFLDLIILKIFGGRAI